MFYFTLFLFYKSFLHLIFNLNSQVPSLKTIECIAASIVALKKMGHKVLTPNVI
jgi:hypothetical protein